MTEHSSIDMAGTLWSGDDLLAMITAGAQVLESHVDVVNNLNVFPVQDGDTGVNMLLTLRDTLNEGRSAEGDTADVVAKAMWQGARMGAKGNGGSIVSQLFKGMSEAFDRKSVVSAGDFAAALQLARGHAYQAIGDPVEGTMLTVFTHAAEAAAQNTDAACSADDMLSATCQAAKDAVALTPTLLPRLREAGVVDSGGLGLWMILEGIRRHAACDDTAPDDLDMPLPEGVEGAGYGVSLEFLDMTDEEEYGNCTQFVIQGEALDIDRVRSEMSARGQSAVVIGDNELIKVHVHTETPDMLLDYARTLGRVSRVSVENMDEQRERLALNQRQNTGAQVQIIPIPVLVIVWGDGLEAIFREQGASVMKGGDTMNPSVREILDAVEKVPYESVIMLPNNSNILPAARQAAEASDKTLVIVPTTNIPQGISAILRFLPNISTSDNAVKMEKEMENVRTAEITRSARSVTLDGVTAEEGQLIGLMERRMVSAGKGLTDTALAILRSVDADDLDLITLYRGEPVTEDEADQVVSDLESTFPLIDFQHYYGGQPYYHFIISVE